MPGDPGSSGPRLHSWPHDPTAPKRCPAPDALAEHHVDLTDGGAMAVDEAGQADAVNLEKVDHVVVLMLAQPPVRLVRGSRWKPG